MHRRTRTRARFYVYCPYCDRDNKLHAAYCRCCRTRLPLWYAGAALCACASLAAAAAFLF